ncbi:MAG: phosphoribosylanthranilate isomerase [Magnetovibrio sp.]|nr:phosphoribosylanthranilate isomerase [Magnetovibrio sp.]
MSIDVKICGINSVESLDAAIAGGAKMLGFVFVNKSPRVLTRDEARDLLARVPEGIIKVALMVGPHDFKAHSIGSQLPFDMVQLHGSEKPQRVADISAITGRPVIKAIGIETAQDIALAHAYEDVCDHILLDAKPPKDATVPGGNAQSFDWDLIAGEKWQKPWLLAGGLSVANLAEAVKTSGAGFVDVSSGVEDAPGQKSPQKIREFLKLAKSL